MIPLSTCAICRSALYSVQSRQSALASCFSALAPKHRSGPRDATGEAAAGGKGWEDRGRSGSAGARQRSARRGRASPSPAVAAVPRRFAEADARWILARGSRSPARNVWIPRLFEHGGYLACAELCSNVLECSEHELEAALQLDARDCTGSADG